jgi:hypothetical protein
LDKEKAMLLLRNPSKGKDKGVLHVNDVNSAKLTFGDTMGRIGLGVVFGVLTWDLPLGELLAFSDTETGRVMEIRRRLEEKELTDKTVYPGGTNCGFLYFKYDIEDLNDIKGLLLRAKNIRTNEETEIIVKINESIKGKSDRE